MFYYDVVVFFVIFIGMLFSVGGLIFLDTLEDKAVYTNIIFICSNTLALFVFILKFIQYVKRKNHELQHEEYYEEV